jgi:hypothetical protein
MIQDYDVFEQFPDDSVCWRARVLGDERAKLKLEELVTRSTHRFFAINLNTRKTIWPNPRNSQGHSNLFEEEQLTCPSGNNY